MDVEHRQVDPGRARRARALVAGAVAAGLIVRLAFALGYWVDKPLTLDEQEYLLLAGNLAAGRGFTYAGTDQPEGRVDHVGRAPGYPLFVAGILRMTGAGDEPRRALPAVKVVQALIGALGVWLLAALAGRAGGARAAVAAAWLAALYPPLIWMPAYVLSETLYSVLALLTALMLSRAIDNGGIVSSGPGPAFAAGLLAGVAALTRPAMLFFLLLAAAWLLARRRPALASALALGFALVVAPWSARNLHEYGRFVLIASEGGVTFWTGNNPLARGEGDLAANPGMKAASLALKARNPGRTPEELESVYYREAIGYVVGHPAAWLALEARKAFYLVVPVGPSYRLHSTRYLVASVVSYGLLLPAAVAGFLTLRRRRASPRALGLLLASAILVALVFFPQERFRIPVIDPVLIAWAAAWLATIRMAPPVPSAELVDP